MRKAIFVTFLAVFSLTVSNVARADEWGCKCIMCLSNPGGATEYSECVPPIERLWRHLHYGGSFPGCDMGSNSGVAVEEGYEKWEPCKKGYSPAVYDKPCGEQTTCGTVRMCRRQTGVRKVAIYGDGPHPVAHRTAAVYDEYKQKRRSEPFWIQVNVGEQKGKKHYYSRSR